MISPWKKSEEKRKTPQTNVRRGCSINYDTAVSFCIRRIGENGIVNSINWDLQRKENLLSIRETDRQINEEKIESGDYD